MIISRCNKADLPAIQHLMAKYGDKMPVDINHINKRDYAYQARLPSGELIAFVWVALMANNTIAYVDKVAIDPEYSGKGIMHAMFKELFPLFYAKGVKTLTGVIRQDEYFLRSAKNALRNGIGGDTLPYSYVCADMNFIKKELGI